MPNRQVLGKLPETIKELKEIVDLNGKALRKMGKLKDVLREFKQYNSDEKSIYTVEVAILNMYINRANDEDIKKGLGNLIEEIRALQK